MKKNAKAMSTYNLKEHTLIHFFEQSVAKFPDRVYLWEKPVGSEEYLGTTYNETRELVHQLAAGLMALGLNRGDRVALLSEERNAWVISELAILYNGAVNVPLSTRLTELDEIRFRLEHSEARMIIASANQLPKLRSMRSNLNKIERVILLDEIMDKRSGEITYRDVIEKGEELLETDRNSFDMRCSLVHPDDPANICYTSGTTADPKGIILTHRNYVTNIHQAYSLMDITPDFRTLLILPWDHSFAHTAGIYCFMGKGASIASVQQGKTQMESLKNIPKNIKEIRPSMLLSAPAMARNFKKNIETGILEKGRFISRIFRNGLEISIAYNGNGWNRGKGLTFAYIPLMWAFDRFLFSKIRKGFGGKLEFFIGGAALLDIKYQNFFYALKIPMFQGYGLSEASPIIACNAKNKHKLGTSGAVVKDLQIRFVDERGKDLPQGVPGEIVVKGDNVMKGYWRNEEATRNVLKDGWLFTGDMGYLDSDGFLYVLGRYKSLLIANDGEKYSPEGMEESFAGQSQYINQCMLYNNQDPYTVLLISPVKEALKNYVQQCGLDPGSNEGRESALMRISAEIQEYGPSGRFSGMFPRRWLPAAIGILEEGFTTENRMMNSTMKIVRGKIIEHHKDLISFLYTPEAKSIVNFRNLAAISTILK